MYTHEMYTPHYELFPPHVRTVWGAQVSMAGGALLLAGGRPSGQVRYT
jgi:hypothetical protein